MQLKNKTAVCLKIAVSLPVKGTFSYAVPECLVPQARVGCRALVPFGSQKVTGYILERIPPDRPDNGVNGLKEILEVLDSEPLFHPMQVSFFEWMANYYFHPIGRVIRSALPGGLNTDPFKTAYLTKNGERFLAGMPPPSKEKDILLWIKTHPGRRPPWPIREIYALQKRGRLLVEDRKKKQPAGPLKRKFIRAKKGADLQPILKEKGASLNAKNELEFLDMVFGSDATPLTELTSRFTNGLYLTKKWIKKGVLEDYTSPVYRNPAGTFIWPTPVPQKLNRHQEQALQDIGKCLDGRSFASYLLYGVTSSGKTEVYYRAVEHVLRSDRQAILIVPEISLAVYMEAVFTSRLGGKVAIYHSGLSQGERYDQWVRMARGDVGLVIGARSALFAPLPRLGLIIVDEEHDSGYKQDRGPRYQARDTAVVRAKIEKTLVILGSGTPSVQSFQNCINGRYRLLSMPERVKNRPLPDIDIVDMKTVKGTRKEDVMLSPKLKHALEQNLMSKNQTILFLNRRGFHRLYLCRSCGKTLRCPNCDVALTYHLNKDHLTCHYCGFSSGGLKKCPLCGSKSLRPFGFGTEKLEQELTQLFPDAEIARMDTDNTRKKGQGFQILKKFGRHEIDILLGTQIITKGYDFPMVTLVGVISADLSLEFPDFRAGERTFQLLSQVAGRSGRGNQRGRVIIQTFNPDHYAICSAGTHDYHSFFTQDLKTRELLNYPPFSHLACLKVQGNDKKKTADTVHQLARHIRTILNGWPKRGKEIQVLGPAEAPISRLKGKYRWQILLKSKSVSLLNRLLVQVEIFSNKAVGVQVILDVDPYQMI